MKKIIIVCLNLILIISLGACSFKKTSSENKKTPAETNTPKADTSQEKVNIKVSMPDGWTAVAGSVLPVHYMKDTSSTMVKEEKFSSKALDDIVLEVKGIFNKTFENTKYIGEVEKITVDGFDGRKFLMTCNVSKLNMKYEYVYLSVNDHIYVITFGDFAKTFDSHTQDYQQILENISFN
ncbi:MAG: hypothetical protein WCQ54_04025 [Clostridiaceae bacterium]